MREETDDGGASLQLGLELGNQREGLGVRVVEVEDDETWTILFLTSCKRGDGLFFIFDEGDFDSEFASSLLNLRDEEEIFDEEEDLGGRVLWNGDGTPLRVVDGLGVALIAAPASVTVAAALIVALVGLDGGRRSVGEVAVDRAVAVIHGANEAAWAALLLAATAFSLEAATTVARLMSVAVAVSAAAAGDVAGILGRTLAVPVAELLLPALAAATGGVVLLLAGIGLEALRLRRLGRGRSLDGGDGLFRVTAGLGDLGGVGAFILPLAATTAAAFRLPHPMLRVMRCELRLPVLLDG